MELINKMEQGDRKAIIQGLSNKGAFIRVNGIVFAVRNHFNDPMITKMIKDLTKDDICLFGTGCSYRVSDFASAALDLLGISKYLGSRQETKSLIAGKMNF